MRTKKQKKKELSEEQLEIVEAKDFFDRTMPGVIRFYTDHYICGNFYKSCGDGVSAKYGRNGYTCSPCGQERCNAPYLQPPCYKHGAKEDRSAGNEEKSYDDNC